MTSEEFAALVARIEALWPGATWLDESQTPPIFEQLRSLTVDACLEAVEAAFTAGREWPPKPSQLRATAALADVRLRDTRSLPEETGRQPAAAFAATHGGYSPSQWARLRAGVDPGPPRFPADEVSSGGDTQHLVGGGGSYGERNAS